MFLALREETIKARKKFQLTRNPHDRKVLSALELQYQKLTEKLNHEQIEKDSKNFTPSRASGRMWKTANFITRKKEQLKVQELKRSDDIFAISPLDRANTRSATDRLENTELGGFVF